MFRALLFGLLAGIPICAAVEVHLEVDAQLPMTRRMLFVVDRSGSMHGDHFHRALNAVSQLLETPTDDLEVGVIAFNDATIRWPGRPEPERAKPVPPGWASLPSEEAVSAANRWLEELGAGGDTLIMPALRDALAEPRKELSVVLVTDGLFGRERTSEIHALIASLQEDRERRGLERAVIGVYGLGAPQKILYEIAEMGRGGYLREEAPPEDEDAPAMIQPTKSLR